MLFLAKFVDNVLYKFLMDKFFTYNFRNNYQDGI